MTSSLVVKISVTSFQKFDHQVNVRGPTLMYLEPPGTNCHLQAASMLRDRVQNKKANVMDLQKDNCTYKVYLSTHQFIRVVLRIYFYEKEQGPTTELSNTSSREGHTSKGVQAAHTELDGLIQEEERKRAQSGVGGEVRWIWRTWGRGGCNQSTLSQILNTF